MNGTSTVTDKGPVRVRGHMAATTARRSAR